MNLFEELTKGVIIHKDQGYAFYYKQGDIEINQLNGKTKDIKSSDITFDSCFRLASVSKQFIGCGIIFLVEKGLLTYDTSVLDIYSELPDYFRNIKIINLLNHSSGIYDYENMDHDDTQIHDEDIITFLKTTTNTYFDIGTQYKYSNTAYILLGLIIEKISGIKLDKYMYDEVFSKANLNNTLVNYEGITKINNRAYGHILSNNELIVKDQYWCSATIGDGGIYSTLNDLNKWVDYLLCNIDYFNNNLLSESILTNVSNTYYGMGVRTVKVNNKKIYYHSGDTIGTNTLVLFSKDYNLRCIFLTNINGVYTAIIKNNLLKILNS